MSLSPINNQLILPNNQRVNIGSSQHYNTNQIVQSLPRGIYETVAPLKGKGFHELGKLNTGYEQLGSELKSRLLRKQSIDTKEINKYFEIYEIKKYIIFQIYHDLRNAYTPWNENKNTVLTQYKSIFITLEKHGAVWAAILDNQNILKEINKEEFIVDLTTFVFGPSALGGILAGSKLSDNFKDYRIKAEMLLKLGADINGVHYRAPHYGTVLHRCLANELPCAVDLVKYIESKRAGTLSNTQFNYRMVDELKQTPLYLAILTRQENVALKLLQLHIKGIDVGINIPNNEGRTPLMIAAAVGLPNIVCTLLKLGADPLAKDNKGYRFNDYLIFNEQQLKEMLLPILNPERGNLTRHSYLYDIDENVTPLCFYNDKEQEKFDDDQYSHLILLSPLPQHANRIKKVFDFLRAEASSGNKESAQRLEFMMYQVCNSGDKTFLDVCKEGQHEVKKLLQSSSGQKDFSFARENALRRACAVGDIVIIQYLLKEGVNPNAQDSLLRTAMHFAVMRSQLVRKELSQSKYEKGCDNSISESEIIDCVKSHAQVLNVLLTQSKIPVDLTITNKSGNSIVEILKRESTKPVKNNEDQVDVNTALDCLKMINFIPQRQEVPYNDNKSKDELRSSAQLI